MRIPSGEVAVAAVLRTSWASAVPVKRATAASPKANLRTVFKDAGSIGVPPSRALLAPCDCLRLAGRTARRTYAGPDLSNALQFEPAARHGHRTPQVANFPQPCGHCVDA